MFSQVSVRPQVPGPFLGGAGVGYPCPGPVQGRGVP